VETNAINQYQSDANQTCSPMTPEQVQRLAQCAAAIGYMTDVARPALHLADVIKKYVYYGREPDRPIPHFIKNPTASMRTVLAVPDDKKQNVLDLIHGIIGCLSEGEEDLTNLKMLAQGLQTTTEQEINMMEETGDKAWYLALIARGLGLKLDSVLVANIRKLHAKRFKGGVYSNDAANNRNLEEEAKALANQDTDAASEDVIQAIIEEPSGKKYADEINRLPHHDFGMGTG
jgi:hypothetical protein